MDGWRDTLDYAVVVCPIYQLPGTTSQIYQQAIARNVCILSYCHLAALVALSREKSKKLAQHGLHLMLQSVSELNPGKNARDYWQGINQAMLLSLGKNAALWTEEKKASLDGLQVVKDEALAYLRAERKRLLGLSHKQALAELLQSVGLDSRIAMIEKIQHGELLGV